jgi:hypothetical protein
MQDFADHAVRDLFEVRAQRGVQLLVLRPQRAPRTASAPSPSPSSDAAPGSGTASAHTDGATRGTASATTCPRWRSGTPPEDRVSRRWRGAPGFDASLRPPRCARPPSPRPRTVPRSWRASPGASLRPCLAVVGRRLRLRPIRGAHARQARRRPRLPVRRRRAQPRLSPRVYDGAARRYRISRPPSRMSPSRSSENRGGRPGTMRREFATTTR